MPEVNVVEMILGWFQANGPMLYVAALQIIGGFAIIARFTPNKSDDRIIQMILDTINFTGFNHGKAANK